MKVLVNGCNNLMNYRFSAKTLAMFSRKDMLHVNEQSSIPLQKMKIIMLPKSINVRVYEEVLVEKWFNVSTF